MKPHVRAGAPGFFACGEAAREAGVRPCLRCHPDGADPVGELAARTQTLLSDHRDGSVTLAGLGRDVELTMIRSTLRRASYA